MKWPGLAQTRQGTRACEVTDRRSFYRSVRAETETCDQSRIDRLQHVDVVCRSPKRMSVHTEAAAHGTAQARARKAGVSSVVPLMVCFLPAFILIGVVPIVGGVASRVLQ